MRQRKGWQARETSSLLAASPPSTYSPKAYLSWSLQYIEEQRLIPNIRQTESPKVGNTKIRAALERIPGKFAVL